MDHQGRPPPGCLAGAGRLLALRRRAVVLGADLLVPGDFTPEPLGADQLTAHVDGYDVTLGGSVEAGEETVLTATVTRAGEPVTDLQPYLGAYGHLVSLRDGDLGYLHVHPEDDTGPGPEISFGTEFPSCRPVPALPRLPARGRRSTPRRSRCRSTEQRAVAMTTEALAPRRRAGHHGHDLRVLRQPHRAQAQQARGRHGQRQLRHRAGPGHATRRRSPPTSSSRRSRRPGTPPRLPGSRAGAVRRRSGTPSSRRSASGCWSRRCSPCRSC